MVARELPRSVYVLQAGLVLNAFGNGAANPFMLIYLHSVRGIPLAVAGLASATSATCALAASLWSGSLADRVGARATLLAGLGLSTTGFALYPLVHEGWHAILVATLTGSGVGTWLTGQSALLAALVPPAQRAVAFAQQRVAANVGLGLGAFAGGLIVAGGEPRGFELLFLLNAATFVLYGLAISRIDANPHGRPRPEGGYREVLRDRVFLRFALLNFAVVGGAIALLNGLFPVYARDEAGVNERTIGLLFLLNSVTIIVAQIPVARRQAGRRRLQAFARMGVLFAAAWLLVLTAGGLGGTRAVAVLVLAVLVISWAECLYDAIQGPLTADFARDRLTGRYMAVNGFSWQLGFIAGPAVGAVVLAAEPSALWLLAASVCAVVAVASLALERRLPAALVRSPA